MSAIKLPVVNGPEKNNLDAAKTVNRNFQMLDARTNYSNGGLTKGVLGNAGDSMAGYASGPQSALNGDGFYYSATLNMMRTYHYCADFVMDTRPYYDPERGDIRMPEGQRGRGFGKGGSPVSHFLETQVPYILESPPEFLYLRLFQNGDYWMDDQTRAATDIVKAKDGIQQLTDAGITIFLADVSPHSNVGGGTNLAYHKHRISHEMQNWSARQHGVHFIPFFERIKAIVGNREKNGIVDWLPGSDRGDGLHGGVLAAWLEAEPHADVFRPVIPEYQMPVLDLGDFNAAFNPYGNVLGGAGAMLGTGGLFNGVANANVPAGIEITYPTDKGVTITPSIITRDGRPVLRLASEGTVTPTGSGNIAVTFPITKALPSALYETCMRGRWVNAGGWGGLVAGGGFPIRNSTGEVGPLQVLPFPLDRPWTMLTGRPRGLANNAGNRIEIALTSAFVGGVPFGGAIEVERAFFGRSDNDA